MLVYQHPGMCTPIFIYLDICFNPKSNNFLHTGKHHLFHLLEPSFHHALWVETDREAVTVSQAWREGPWAEASFLSGQGWREAKGLHTFKPVFFNYWFYTYLLYSKKCMSQKRGNREFLTCTSFISFSGRQLNKVIYVSLRRQMTHLHFSLRNKILPLPYQ